MVIAPYIAIPGGDLGMTATNGCMVEYQLGCICVDTTKSVLLF